MKHFPIFFFIFDKACEDKLEREGVPFSATANQQNITASLHHRDHLSLKGLNSSSTFFETSEMSVVKGHQEHNTVMHTQAATFCSQHRIFLYIYSLFSFFLVVIKSQAVSGNLL